MQNARTTTMIATVPLERKQKSTLKCVNFLPGILREGEDLLRRDHFKWKSVIKVARFITINITTAYNYRQEVGFFLCQTLNNDKRYMSRSS